MKRMIISLAIFVAMMMFVGVESASAQIKTDGRRAISLGTCVEESALPQEVRDIITQNNLEQYVDNNTTNGMSPKSAKSLGWDVKGVWNERPGRGKPGDKNYRPTMWCFTLLDVDAIVDTMNGDPSPKFGYLHGCAHANIPGFKNRVVPPPPVLVTKTEEVKVPCRPDEMGMTLRNTETLPNGDVRETWYDGCNYDRRTITKAVQLPPIREVIAACPAGIRTDAKTSWGERLGGGKLQAAISVIASGGITAIRGGDFNDIWHDGLKGGITQRVEQVVNPGDSLVQVYLPGISKPYQVKRGENKELVPGLFTRWKGSYMFVISQVQNQEYVCGAAALKEASNLAVWTSGEDLLSGTKTLPTGPGGPTPIRPRVFTWADVQNDPRFGGPSAFTGGGLGYTNQVVGNTTTPATTPATQVAEPVIPRPKIRLASNMRVVDN